MFMDGLSAPIGNSGLVLSGRLYQFLLKLKANKISFRAVNYWNLLFGNNIQLMLHYSCKFIARMLFRIVCSVFIS